MAFASAGMSSARAGDLPHDPKVTVNDQAATDFFISYAQADEQWAEWIAWELEEAGYRTVLQAWDFRPGRRFIAEMQDACVGARRTIATLSPAYLQSRFTSSEWSAALARDPGGASRPLIPVRVAPCEPEGLLGQIAFVDMVGLDETGCREALLDGVAPGRCKPAVQPAFPGNGARSVQEQPMFPGAFQRRGGAGGAMPRFRTRRAQALSARLEAAYLEQETLAGSGRETAEVHERILALRRELREGGRLQAGDILGARFKLIQVLGAGGFATVWKAFDRQERELVAVKVLHGQYADDRTRRDRFQRGARRMGALRHPGIVPVLDHVLEDEGHYYFVMELVDGPNLHEAVLADPPPLDERLRILLEVGDALQFAHDERMVHRDIKPANILLQNRRTPKLTDFDLVHVSDTTGGTRSEMLGTVMFAAPETWLDARDASVTADVYSLGMTSLFTLAGEPLPLDVIRDAPGFIDTLPLPGAYRPVLARAVAWEPQDRYPTVREFCAELENPSPEPPAAVPPPSLLRRVRNRLNLGSAVPRARSGVPEHSPQTRDMTVLFSDGRGMTSISEGLAPVELAAFMNAFLEPLSNVVEQLGGTVDNYMGDAIMAHWGAADGDPDHARHALEAGLEMIATVDRLAPEFERRGWPPVRIGVGVNSGPMIYGRFAARGNPTVMGDAVNLGSRLEGMTKGYGVHLIAGQATAEQVHDHVFRELDRVRVKGKDAPMTIYEPLGPRRNLDKALAREIELHDRALRAYRQGEWDEAQRQFLELARAFPNRTVYRLYADRIAHLRTAPPESDWDGVFTFTTG